MTKELILKDGKEVVEHLIHNEPKESDSHVSGSDIELCHLKGSNKKAVVSLYRKPKENSFVLALNDGINEEFELFVSKDRKLESLGQILNEALSLVAARYAENHGFTCVGIKQRLGKTTYYDYVAFEKEKLVS